MYKLSVTFFVLLFSMTTFVAAAQDGTRQSVMMPFWKRAPESGNKALQMQVLRGAVTSYCTPHRQECLTAIGNTESLEQLEQGSVGGGAQSNMEQKKLVVQKAITAYCALQRQVCMAAIGKSGNLEQFEKGAGGA